ncbi:MAG: Uma2 family endonuclease [Pirellulaceae bacterium]
MTNVSAPQTLADLLRELGEIPLERIRLYPPPGTATEQSVLEVEAQGRRLCELVDGVLVEKAMGYVESIIAGAILAALRQFVVPKNLGHVSGPDGIMRLFPGLVRMPDVAFAAWDRFPDGRLPGEPIPDLVPDLVVEVVSAGNTPAEMDRKRHEYFEAGVRLVWIVDPSRRTVAVFCARDKYRELTEVDTLDGSDVLAGFSLSVADVFAELDRQAGGA